MERGSCAEYSQLAADVVNILEHLTQLTSNQLKAFRDNDLAAVAHYDHELEQSIGKKERTIGALKQHIKEHHCVAIEP